MIDEEQAPDGIESGAELREFADAILSCDVARTDVARQALTASIGYSGTVDAAAVVGNFQRMVRIADSTGIPLDEPVLMISQSIRDELGINEFHAASNSPRLSIGKRLLGRLLAPLAPRLLQKMASKTAEEQV
ncbi:MAG: hypothetical protein AAF541_19835 [Pseudomonadota bacterium]